MRKTLVAVALACAFPAVYAQSNVTVYGILDAGIEVLDAGNETLHATAGLRHVVRQPLRHSRQ